MFIQCLRKSPSSPYKKLSAIFARKEYQVKQGNLSHAHMMIQLNWDEMSPDEKAFVDDLIRAGIFDIVRSDEVDDLINEGIFENEDDIIEVIGNAEKFLPHRCNDTCLVRRADGTLQCRKIDNVNATPDNRSHQYVSIPNNYSVECLKVLDKVGLLEELDIDDDGNVKHFKSSKPFFHPVRHVPPTNPTNDLNISPVLKI